MKGTFFQKALELNLHIEGESWAQGDMISGSLKVKNHGGEPLSLPDIGVHLAYGELKQVRLKTPDAFEILNSILFEPHEKLDPQKDAVLNWKFQTDRNCPITDKSGSLFILYGKGKSSEHLGQLQLPVHAFELIQEFLKIISTEFRFVVKNQKTNKGQVEVKLSPPDSKSFAMLDCATLFFKFEGEALEVKYVFNVKKIEATAAKFDVTKKKKDITQTFLPTQYRTQYGRVNHTYFEDAIKAALSEVESKVTF